MKAIALMIAGLLLLVSPAAFAQQQNPRPVLTPGSDASFDKRLPPVFPGEEVSDGRETMKVWSSSGPVPVGQAPEPWRKHGGARYDAPAGVGVIVDRREDSPPAHPPSPEAPQTGGGSSR